MKAPQYSIEPEYKVWDEENGVYISIAPDPDGLGCVAVSYKESGSVDRISMPPEMALLVAEAIKRIADHLIADEQRA